MNLSIDIVSDVVCPWCFIGKRRLDTAVAQLASERPDVEVTRRWLPYFLNPDTPPEGVPYRPFLERKFGGAAQVDAILARVAEAGRSTGIEFAHDKIRLRANTTNAHRLIHRLQTQGLGDAVVERLFAAHFLDGQYVGDIDVLADIAAACGDDRSAARAYLDSEQDLAEIHALVRQAQTAGVSGVPFFIFNDRLALSGAQAPDIMLGAMRQALSG